MENGLVGDIEKCVLQEKEIELLAYMISEKGVGMGPVQLEVMTK